jgi:hypothetical protein
MKYWVIRHDLVDSYLGRHHVPGRRWDKFEDAQRFGTKEAAVMAADVLFAGACKVLEVTDELPEYLTPPETLTEWYRQRLEHHLAHQAQHRQGIDA